MGVGEGPEPPAGVGRGRLASRASPAGSRRVSGGIRSALGSGCDGLLPALASSPSGRGPVVTAPGDTRPDTAEPAPGLFRRRTGDPPQYWGEARPAPPVRRAIFHARTRQLTR